MIQKKAVTLHRNSAKVFFEILKQPFLSLKVVEILMVKISTT